MEQLPRPSAMHRDIPPGSRLKVANAYALGQLIDRARLPKWLQALTRRYV